MALAVTHILVTIIILDLFRHYVFGHKKFPRYLLVIGGIAGLAPDLDIPLGWLFSAISGNPVNYHGSFTHSFLFVGIFLLIGLLRHFQQEDEIGAKIFYVIAVAWMMHLSLDCLYGWGKNFFWPFAASFPYCPSWNLNDTYAVSIDAVLLVVWLVHEEVHKKVKDYF